MEVHLLQRKTSLQSKLPEIQKTLSMVQLLEEKSSTNLPIKTQFELCDTLFSKALINPTTHVHLWLGANVMLEYPISEAKDLLKSKLDMATKRLTEVEEDLEFLREQITTMEVNLARLFNWDVKVKRSAGK
jgi:prefoldin subunit 5